MEENMIPPADPRIAVIGMAGRFPGAGNLDEFWENLRAGRESVRFLSAEEMLAGGADPTLLDDPDYVRAVAELPEADAFDAPFFGISHREAETLDPQQRVLLECAWHALENAGYDPGNVAGRVGLYAGATTSTYLLFHLLPGLRAADPFQLLLGNAVDTLTTRVAYKLNLRGPTFAVQCACSTSLVAVHLAAESLLDEECDTALAGGVSINYHHRLGYRFVEGSIASPDGHCRPFDARAGGTIFGSGVGVVVLKRLADALADGDPIRAVVLGSAVNNDGSLRVGYTAPSVEGQAEVIGEALEVAGVDPETMGYIEGHGTATDLGDPIEIQALTRAFGERTERKQFCAIGSVKSNIGHLDVAAGIAGLIKTILALEHRRIPPTLHFERPNPKIDFAASPVRPASELREWERGAEPRRAGVSSFGMGGTNAHVILEEAPEREPSGASRPWQLLMLSAKTGPSLEAATAALAGYLGHHGECALADVAHTLAVGRKAFSHRRIAVCRDPAEAAALLAGEYTPGSSREDDGGRLFTQADTREPWDRPVVFMFSGQGAQHVGMGWGLYEHEPVFRAELDRCAEGLAPHLGLDLRRLLYPRPEEAQEAGRRLTQTALAQPALYAVEYALAALWRQWGIEPEAMIGHSIGEYVAATLAGVFSLEDALGLVAARGRLMQEMPAGEMLSVPLPEDEVTSLLGEELSIAAINAPRLCVVSGPGTALGELRRRLAERNLEGRRLHTSHAFHSAMMEPILERFTAEVAKTTRNAPAIPWVSNLTGTWVTAAEVTAPSTWAKQLRQTVRFADGIATLAAEDERIFLEIGPGQALSSLVRQAPARPVAIPSMRHPRDTEAADQAVLLTALGRLWLAGRRLDGSRLYAGEKRRHLPLPGYPFERHRYLIARGAGVAAVPEAAPVEEDAVAVGQLHARPGLDTEYLAPRNPLEERIATIWQELLGVEQIGVHDRFLDLGGHSLLATQVVSRLYDRFEIRIPLEQFFAGATVAELARQLDKLLWTTRGLPSVTRQGDQWEEREI